MKIYWDEDEDKTKLMDWLKARYSGKDSIRIMADCVNDLLRIHRKMIVGTDDGYLTVSEQDYIVR